MSASYLSVGGIGRGHIPKPQDFVMAARSTLFKSNRSQAVRLDLGRKGTPIGDYDVLIAGRARSRGLIVMTAGLGEIRRVEVLGCEGWLNQV